MTPASTGDSDAGSFDSFQDARKRKRPQQNLLHIAGSILAMSESSKCMISSLVENITDCLLKAVQLKKPTLDHF